MSSACMANDAWWSQTLYEWLEDTQGKLQGTLQRVVSILHFGLSAGPEKVLPKVQLPAFKHTGTLSSRATAISVASEQ